MSDDRKYRFPLHSVARMRTDRCFRAVAGAKVYYKQQGASFVVAGDPVASSVELAREALLEFVSFGRSQGKAVVGYYFSKSLRDLLSDFKFIEAGVSRVLDLHDFKPVGYKWRDFRRALNQGERSSLQLIELSSDNCSEWFASIKKMEARWLRSRKGPSIGFLLSRVARGPTNGERWFVVIDDDDRVQSFATIASYAGSGCYLDQMIQCPDGHRFAMDFLLAKLALLLKQERVSEFSLGFCAFTRVSGPSWYEYGLRLLGKSEFLYNSQGIYQYKKKFSNREEKRYLLLDDEMPIFAQIQSLLRVTYPLIYPWDKPVSSRFKSWVASCEYVDPVEGRG